MGATRIPFGLMNAAATSIPIYHRNIFGPEDLAEAISHAQFEARQLAPSSGASVLERISMSQSCLDTARLGMPLHFQGVAAPGAFTLIFVDQCPTPGHLLNHSVQHGGDHMGFFAPAGGVDGLTPDGYTNASLTIPVRQFLDEVGTTYPEIPDEIVKKGAGLRLRPEDSARIRRVVAALRTGLGAGSAFSSRMLGDIEADLVAAFLLALRNACTRQSQKPAPRPARQKSMLCEVIDLIQLAPHEASIATICRHTGQSRRTIEYLFRNLLDTSPSHYVRVAKLHAARRTLLAGGPDSALVKQAAFEAGFWHLGHFSGAYRTLFGESPGTTLQRRRK